MKLQPYILSLDTNALVDFAISRWLRGRDFFANATSALGQFDSTYGHVFLGVVQSLLEDMRKAIKARERGLEHVGVLDEWLSRQAQEGNIRIVAAGPVKSEFSRFKLLAQAPTWNGAECDYFDLAPYYRSGLRIFESDRSLELADALVLAGSFHHGSDILITNDEDFLALDRPSEGRARQDTAMQRLAIDNQSKPLCLIDQRRPMQQKMITEDADKRRQITASAPDFVLPLYDARTKLGRGSFFFRESRSGKTVLVYEHETVCEEYRSQHRSLDIRKQRLSFFGAARVVDVSSTGIWFGAGDEEIRFEEFDWNAYSECLGRWERMCANAPNEERRKEVLSWCRPARKDSRGFIKLAVELQEDVPARIWDGERKSNASFYVLSA